MLSLKLREISAALEDSFDPEALNKRSAPGYQMNVAWKQSQSAQIKGKPKVVMHKSNVKETLTNIKLQKQTMLPLNYLQIRAQMQKNTPLTVKTL